MSKKRYCKTCQNLIEEGKEIKIKKATDYYHGRYSSRPRSYVTYYLCPSCHQKYEEERRTKHEKNRRYIIGTCLGIFVALIAGIILFFIYHQHQDKKTRRLTRQAQKKNINN